MFLFVISSCVAIIEDNSSPHYTPQGFTACAHLSSDLRETRDLVLESGVS